MGDGRLDELLGLAGLAGGDLRPLRGKVSELSSDELRDPLIQGDAEMGWRSFVSAYEEATLVLH